MQWIVDRIEENIAVMETANGNMLNVPKNALPENIKEGDVVLLSVDEAATQKRKKEAKDLLRSLLKKETD